MTVQGQIPLDQTRQLAMLCRAGVLPAKLQSSAASLLAKLEAPVRIGLIGLPGANKRRLLDALTGTAISRAAPELPPLELSYGPHAQTTAILGDGATLSSAGTLPRDLMEERPVFLSISAPLPALEGREYLLVASDATLEDLAAALTWAAPKIDMALWCSRAWDHVESAAWREAPDLLRNHALFIATGRRPPAMQKSELIAEGFEHAFHIAGGEEPDHVARLAAHISNQIEEGRVEDQLAAQLFLQRHQNFVAEAAARPRSVPAPAPGAPRPGRAATERIRSRVVQAEPEPDTPRATASPKPPDPAQIALSRQFQYLRQAAETLRQRLSGGTLDAETLDAALSTIEQTFEHLAERVADGDLIEDRWPDIVERVSAARDLSVLLRIEGAPHQLADAARLMRQVRQEFETRLAA